MNTRQNNPGHDQCRNEGVQMRFGDDAEFDRNLEKRLAMVLHYDEMKSIVEIIKKLNREMANK